MSHYHNRRFKAISSPIEQLDKIALDFSDDIHIIHSMQEIEKLQWNYIDNYHLKNRLHYPYLNLRAFMSELFTFYEIPHELTNIQQYFVQYNKYKKTLPTAGAIVHYENNILLVKNQNGTVYSMPKGKAEKGETLEQTAIREVKEETGLDLTDNITGSNRHTTIQKTRFYIVETDHLLPRFTGYNPREIADVRWFSFDDILDNVNNFSKQVCASVNYLVGEGTSPLAALRCV